MNANKKAAKKAAAKAGANKQAKKLAKQLGAAVLGRTPEGGRENPYLKCLVNPEQWQFCYPDNFGEKTAVCKFITNRVVNWDTAGAYWMSINPTLPDHIVTKQYSQVAGSYGYTSVTNFATGLILKNGTTQVVPVNSAESASVDNMGQKKILLANGPRIYTPPGMTTTGSVYLNSPDLGVTFELAYWTATTDGLLAIVPGGAAVSIPADTTSVSLRASTIHQTASVTSVKLAFMLAEGPGVQTDVKVPCQNYGDLVPTVTTSAAPAIFEEYRVVSMSALLTYEGDTLYNGGNCTGRIVSGGDTPQTLGWTDYASIASLPDSYEGPLIMGAYGFWVPTDTKDMQFRDCDVTNSNSGDLPSLVFAGVVKNPANAVLRLRTCMVIEAKTYKPYISTTYSTVAPEMIDAAAVALRGIPRIMENPLHLEDIKNFLKSVVEKGRTAYDTAKALAPVAIPVAKALASFLI